MRLNTGFIRSFSCYVPFTVLMLAGLPSSRLIAQTALPETPAGERLKESIILIDSGDYASIRTYINDNYTPSAIKFFGMDWLLDFYLGLHATSGGLDFYSLREITYDKTIGTFKSRLTGLWIDIGFTVEGESPHRIRGISILPAGPPEGMELPQHLSDAEIAREIRTMLEKLASVNAFSGAVLIARDGNILFEGAYGYASWEFRAPNRIDTKFNLASINKMFTAVAIAQLCESGTIDYGDPIGHYLGGDWIPRRIGRKVTVAHLLTHTSGLGDFLSHEVYAGSSSLRFRSLDDYKFLFRGVSLAFRPGSKHSYSNSGYLLLGVIIEKVTGKSYFDYVREHIFEPAGMTSTDSYELDQPVTNLAIGYFDDYVENGILWQNNIYKLTVRGSSAGGGYSTVHDLLKFDIALRTNQLVSEETKNLLLTAKPEMNSPRYGYGFTIQERGGEHFVGHTGGYSGISNVMKMFLDRGYTVIVLSNMSKPHVPVDSHIMELLIPDYFRSMMRTDGE